MLSQSFLGFSLLGAEWVLYILMVISVLSVGIMIERVFFYRKADEGISEFRARFRDLISQQKWDEAAQMARARSEKFGAQTADLETRVAHALLEGSKAATPSATLADSLSELAHEQILRGRLSWEKNLSILGTIGNNAPFIGLFGTVLGIIKAFNDLSRQGGLGAQGVTAGISEALVATAVGILVAIPAVVAFNAFQRKTKNATIQAEALKSFLVGRIGLRK